MRVENGILSTVSNEDINPDGSFNFPNGVTQVADSAFCGCAGLTSISIPISVTQIGDSVFTGCAGLTSITLPNRLAQIGERAFSSCTGLTSITLSNSVTQIGDWAFSGCTGLRSITIPNRVTHIGDSAFYRCTGLTSITLPNSVTHIGRWAFDSCIALTRISIPNRVTHIADSAFYGCAGLTSITLSNSLTQIGEKAFWGCTGLTSIILPNSVTQIGDFAFYDCAGLSTITIPNSAVEIKTLAFKWCESLEVVVLFTENTADIERIKGLLAQPLRQKFVQATQERADKVNRLKSEALYHLINNPLITPLYKIDTIPDDILRFIYQTHQDDLKVVKRLKEQIEKIPFPASDNLLSSYKNALDKIVNNLIGIETEKRNSEEKIIIINTDQAYLAKLNNYKKSLKRLRKPSGFFEKNSDIDIRRVINKLIDIQHKTIKKHNSSNITFNEEQIEILKRPSIRKILKYFGKTGVLEDAQKNMLLNHK